MPLTLTPDAAVARARTLAAPGARVLLGIAGAPGSGKSTLAAQVAAALEPDAAVVVGMDGFHLAQRELERLGRAERKGAPDTFDAAGFVALLGRLRERRDPVVYVPEFRRELEEPIGSAVPVAAAVPLVVCEGNYLLLDDPAWAPVADLLDETWYVDVPEELRLERLVARHVAFGRSPAAAAAWARGTDQRNAERIARCRGRADVLVSA